MASLQVRPADPAGQFGQLPALRCGHRCFHRTKTLDWMLPRLLRTEKFGRISEGDSSRKAISFAAAPFCFDPKKWPGDIAVTGPFEVGLLLLVEVVVHINNMRLQILFEPMLSIGTANTGLTPAGVESLHRFKVFTVNVRFAELQLI